MSHSLLKLNWKKHNKWPKFCLIAWILTVALFLLYDFCAGPTFSRKLVCLGWPGEKSWDWGEEGSILISVAARSSQLLRAHQKFIEAMILLRRRSVKLAYLLIKQFYFDKLFWSVSISIQQDVGHPAISNRTRHHPHTRQQTAHIAVEWKCSFANCSKSPLTFAQAS